MTRLRLAIISTHPIQYYSPVFRELASSDNLYVRVFYTWSQAEQGTLFDAGFGTAVQWDVPLLDGYAYQFVRNVANRPGPQHFRGLITPTLIREIAAWQPEALLVYTWNSQAHLQAMRHFKGRVPVFFRGDSTLLDRRGWLRTRLRRAALRFIYRHIDVAIAVGSNNRDYFAWCGIPPERIAIAPHSVDTQRFSADTVAHEALAAKWRDNLRIAPEAIVVLYAGKLQPKKDPALLLRVFAQSTDGSHLVFVGNGELESALKREAGTLPNVHFLPFQNQSVMPAVYRLGDVFVLPSCGPEETWGLALNEALACGRPVIASSKVGGARDLIVSGANGWTFEASECEELAQVLQRATALGRSGLRAMGETGRTGSAAWSTAASARLIEKAILRAAPRGNSVFVISLPRSSGTFARMDKATSLMTSRSDLGPETADAHDLLQRELSEHRRAFEATAEMLSEPFAQMLEILVTSIKRGGKLLLFGNGGSAADAQHIAAELVIRYKQDRAPIAAIALTTDTSLLTACGNDLGFEAVFERQIEGLGRPGDVAVAVSTSGTSPNVLRGLVRARAMGMKTVGLTGGSGGKMPELCDALIVVPSTVTARIQEMHITVAHVLCMALEQHLGLV